MECRLALVMRRSAPVVHVHPGPPSDGPLGPEPPAVAGLLTHR
ncbi:hypothetical protein [Catenuloplanes japonicus]|nr:hypothetical protein [Catenuloplanes japonicus]